MHTNVMLKRYHGPMTLVLLHLIHHIVSIPNHSKMNFWRYLLPNVVPELTHVHMSVFITLEGVRLMAVGFGNL